MAAVVARVVVEELLDLIARNPDLMRIVRVVTNGAFVMVVMVTVVMVTVMMVTVVMVTVMMVTVMTRG